VGIRKIRKKTQDTRIRYSIIHNIVSFSIKKGN